MKFALVPLGSTCAEKPQSQTNQTKKEERAKPMKLDQIEGKPDDKVAWGSDIAAQMLRRFNIPFISLNPGASYRGFPG
jgi:hypothetical protein